MKKFYIALLFAVSSLAMQTASAATLTLANLAAGSVTSSTGSTVSGHGDGTALSVLGIDLPFSISTWKLDIDSAARVKFDLSGNLPFSSTLFTNSTFTPPPVFSFTGSTGSALLSAGTYYLAIFSGFGNVGQAYDLSVGPAPAVPVPAAVWLFGSAFLGMMGVKRRKSNSGFAA